MIRLILRLIPAVIAFLVGALLAGVHLEREATDGRHPAVVTYNQAPTPEAAGSSE